MKFRWLYCILFVAWLSFASIALPQASFAQTIQFQTSTSEIYAGMPFVISLVLKDFDESPQPTIEPFEIPGTNITFLGASPRISSMVSIINGRRTEKKDVTYVFNYQVSALDAKTYEIPPIRATQGTKTAVTRLASFDVKDVQTTKNMLLELELPERSVWVGESFDVSVLWYLRQEVQDQSFSIPLFEMGDVFELSEPDRQTTKERTLTMQLGARTVTLPYVRENVMVQGIEYTVFKFRAKVTPLKAGEFAIPPSKVLANLQVGTERDDWGFLKAKTQLFKAQDIERKYIVKELPLALKPEAFSNAIGENYSIKVSADRTIVKVGDPVMLKIEIGSDSSLDGLILPNLNTTSGLPETFFSIPNESPVGEVIQMVDGKMIKQFLLPVRIKNDRVREIPPLPFSFFDPKQGKFQTVRSQPIALSVTDVVRVGANDVVVAENAKESKNSLNTKSSEDTSASKQNSLTPAIFPTAAIDLGLSAPDKTLQPAHIDLRPVRLALYGLPWVLLAVLLLARRRKEKALLTAPQRTAITELERAISQAPNEVAKASAASIANAIPNYLSALSLPRASMQDISQKLDEFAFNPKSENSPLPDSLLNELKCRMKEITPVKYKKFLTLVLALLCTVFSFSFSMPSFAQTPSNEESLANARKLYSEALTTEDRAQKLALFNKSSLLFKQVAIAHPSAPNIQADWGNAALSAYDFGNATLAYRRALAIDPTLARAQKNLDFLRTSLSDSVSTPEHSSQAISTLFFLNQTLTPQTRLFLAALFFAIAAMLLLPWRKGSRRALVFLSILPFSLWIWLLSSVLSEHNPVNDGVVLQETLLRTADSAGATSLLPYPLPAGSEITILETRVGWAQVSLSNGQQGWLPDSSFERVVLP